MATKPTSNTPAGTDEAKVRALPESLSQFDELPDSAHVQARTVAAVIGVSEATVWRMAKSGHLPTPKKFSTRSTRWNVGELRRAITVLSREHCSTSARNQYRHQTHANVE